MQSVLTSSPFTIVDRTFSTNIPAVGAATPWKKFVSTLNPTLLHGDRSSKGRGIPAPVLREDRSPAIKHHELASDAVDLLQQCLEPSSVRRITARAALYHPFLAPDKDEIERLNKHRQALENGTSGEAEVEGKEDQPLPLEMEDDELFPHPPGRGACGERHAYNEDEEQWEVEIGDKWEVIEAGEGQAIGKRGCEYHPDAVLETAVDSK